MPASACKNKNRLSESRAASRIDEVVAHHLFLRGQTPPRTRSRQDRAECGSGIHQETRRRDRRGLPGRLLENGGRAGMAMVRYSEHVPERGIRRGRSSRGQRSPHAKDDWPLRWISTSERARSRLKDLPPLATEMPHVGPIAPMCTL